MYKTGNTTIKFTFLNQIIISGDFEDPEKLFQSLNANITHIVQLQGFQVQELLSTTHIRF